MPLCCTVGQLARPKCSRLREKKQQLGFSQMKLPLQTEVTAKG